MCKQSHFRPYRSTVEMRKGELIQHPVGFFLVIRHVKLFYVIYMIVFSYFRKVEYLVFVAYNLL